MTKKTFFSATIKFHENQNKTKFCMKTEQNEKDGGKPQPPTA